MLENNQIMENDQIMENKKITDEKLETVSGGWYHFDNKVVVHMITSHRSTYSSGDTPKYSVGEIVKITYRVNGINQYYFKCDCEVLSVTPKASKGIFCKEFGYTVRVVAAPEKLSYYEDVVGNIYKNVYESCLSRS